MAFRDAHSGQLARHRKAEQGSPGALALLRQADHPHHGLRPEKPTGYILERRFPFYCGVSDGHRREEPRQRSLARLMLDGVLERVITVLGLFQCVSLGMTSKEGRVYCSKEEEEEEEEEEEVEHMLLRLLPAERLRHLRRQFQPHISRTY